MIHVLVNFAKNASEDSLAEQNVLRFWLDRGVDGFRVDAIQTLFEKEHLQDEPPSGLEGFTSVQD